MRSGFVTLVGRPNVGKSTLLNRMLGQRLNDSAREAVADVDVVLFVVDGAAGVGKGDRMIAEQLDRAQTIVVVNKADRASKEQMFEQLRALAEYDFAEYFPVSARTGDGCDDLVDAVVSRLPDGPKYYPDDMVTDVPEAFWVAELVREQLLAVTREELPHSIACRVTEWEWPRVRCEILVERESQKGIVIGKGGSVLKEVGQRAREQLPPGAYLELFVKVDKDWQRRPKALDRLGY